MGQNPVPSTVDDGWQLTMFKLGFWQGTQKWICHTDYRGRKNGGYDVPLCCTVWGALPNANGTGQTNGRREGFTRCSCSGFGWASRCRRRTARLWLWADSRFSCSWGLHFMYNKCMQIRCERLHRGGVLREREYEAIGVRCWMVSAITR